MLLGLGHMLADAEGRRTFMRMVRNSMVNTTPLSDYQSEALGMSVIFMAVGFGAYETVLILTPGIFAIWAAAYTGVINFFAELLLHVSITLNNMFVNGTDFIYNFLGIPILGLIAFRFPLPFILIDAVGFVYAAVHWGPAFFS